MREGRGFRVLSHLRGSLWFVPVLCVGAGVALSFVVSGIASAFPSFVAPPTPAASAGAAFASESPVVGHVYVNDNTAGAFSGFEFHKFIWFEFLSI
jgi:hypothetical protein